jgi:hypothetical protein
VLADIVLKLATPPDAATVVVPDKEPGPEATVSATVSVASVPEVITLPKVSSTEALNVVQVDPAVALVGGSVVKTTLLAAAGLTVVAGVEATVVRVLLLSVAVRV